MNVSTIISLVASSDIKSRCSNGDRCSLPGWIVFKKTLDVAGGSSLLLSQAFVCLVKGLQRVRKAHCVYLVVPHFKEQHISICVYGCWDFGGNHRLDSMALRVNNSRSSNCLTCLLFQDLHWVKLGHIVYALRLMPILSTVQEQTSQGDFSGIQLSTTANIPFQI